MMAACAVRLALAWHSLAAEAELQLTCTLENIICLAVGFGQEVSSSLLQLQLQLEHMSLDQMSRVNWFKMPCLKIWLAAVKGCNTPQANMNLLRKGTLLRKAARRDEHTSFCKGSASEIVLPIVIVKFCCL